MTREPVFCEQCREAGERSKVYEPKGGTRTLMGTSSWYDEDGAYHDHDGNTFTAAWSCSRGHRWLVSTRRGCPAGDVAPERTVRRLDPVPAQE